MTLIDKLIADVHYHEAHVKVHTDILKGALTPREKADAADSLLMAKNDLARALDLLAKAQLRADALDLSSPVTGLGNVKISPIAHILADSIIAKCDSGERIGHRVDKLKNELQKLNDQLRRAIANKDAEEIRDIRKEIENVEADIAKRSRNDADTSGTKIVKEGNVYKIIKDGKAVFQANTRRECELELKHYKSDV